MTEGMEQHNCVGSFAMRVMDGNCYIYKVVQPERATLSIHRKPGGKWFIGELHTACNGRVRPATRKCVEEWLAPVALGI